MDLSRSTNFSDMLGESSYDDKVAGLFVAIDNLPQTTIAAVNGPCFGGGVGLTFVCDLRLRTKCSARTGSGVAEIRSQTQFIEAKVDKEKPAL